MKNLLTKLEDISETPSKGDKIKVRKVKVDKLSDDKKRSRQNKASKYQY